MNTVIRNSIKHLSKHIERCLIKKVHLNDNKIINNKTAKLASHDENIIHNYNNDENHNINNNDENHNIMFTGGQQSCNRTLIVGPSFCGKTHLLLNKLQLIRLDNPEQQLKVITRNPEQYTKFELEEVSVEDLEDRTIPKNNSRF